MAIYRSPAGQRALEEVYTSAIERLDIEIDEHYVKTRHSETHVLSVGPKNAVPVVIFHSGNATNPLTLNWYSSLTDEYRFIAPDTIGQPGYSAETRVDPEGNEYGE